jgi:hypothetical protein
MLPEQVEGNLTKRAVYQKLNESAVSKVILDSDPGSNSCERLKKLTRSARLRRSNGFLVFGRPKANTACCVSLAANPMTESTKALTLQLLEWISYQPRTYPEVLDAWRTTCPRLSIWEDACIEGLIEYDPGGDRIVSVSPKGQELLRTLSPSLQKKI